MACSKRSNPKLESVGHGLCQANCINRSLSALSDVLSALGDSSGNELSSEVREAQCLQRPLASRHTSPSGTPS